MAIPAKQGVTKDLMLVITIVARKERLCRVLLFKNFMLISKGSAELSIIIH